LSIRAALPGSVPPVRPPRDNPPSAPANLHVTQDQCRLYNIFELRAGCPLSCSPQATACPG